MQPNDQFGHFGIIEKLGYGGMAMVYKATDFHVAQEVALKILHEQYSQDEEIIQRFNREADIFYQLKHPNIVPIISHGEHEGKFYIAMDYMSGGTLYDLFRTPEEVDSEFTIHILKQVASALDFAHTQGVIHRDLKLENILLENDTAYLTDFGIAFLIDATRLTSQQAIKGTPLYMSPEQALGLSVTNSTDIYSLAVMAYLMTTGYHPFTGRDPYTVLNQHISQTPPLPTVVNSELPSSINHVLLKGLAKQPQDRYRTANEFVEEFSQALQDDNHTTQILIHIEDPNPEAFQTIDEYQTTVHDPKETKQDSQPIQSKSQSNRTLYVISGLILLVVIVITFALVLTNNNDNSAFAIAQTQARREVELDLTAISFAEFSSSGDESNDDRSESNNSDNEPVGVTTRRVDMFRSPEKDSPILTKLDANVRFTLIGRSGPGDHIHIYINPELSGYIRRDSADTDINITNLPVTHRKGKDEVEPCLASPFGFALVDNVSIFDDPSTDSEVLTTRPLADRFRLLDVDASGDFVYVEVNDDKKTQGHIKSDEIDPVIDLSCLP